MERLYWITHYQYTYNQHISTSEQELDSLKELMMQIRRQMRLSSASHSFDDVLYAVMD